ncbi:MAG: hypothetical protein EOM91_05150 [Sphingobacteriia bacterium]|nr:hypothetical protein [Sphingobacteriia bacterium]NCC38728.1 hypothetical protein [Gammaproteobacteria bacterium]
MIFSGIVTSGTLSWSPIGDAPSLDGLLLGIRGEMLVVKTKSLRIAMNHPWKSVLRTPEGSVLLIGLGLCVALAITLVVSSLWSVKAAQWLASLIASNLVFGRVASMSLGYAIGLDTFAVVLVNALVETILVLVFYPLFLFSWQQLVEVRGFGSYLHRVRMSAERHQEKIRRYGLIGLFVFVWSPIWMTGPVVGCAIGILLGLGMRVTLSVVLAGTYVAMVVWGLAMQHLHDQVSRFSSFGPLAVLAVLAVAVAVAYWLRHPAHKRSSGR